MLDQNNKSGISAPEVWFCDDCNMGHLRIANVCMSFSESEFTQLMEAFLRMYQSGGVSGAATSSDPAESDRVLESDIIL